jgi:hypothetical protein
MAVLVETPTHGGIAQSLSHIFSLPSSQPRVAQARLGLAVSYGIVVERHNGKIDGTGPMVHTETRLPFESPAHV